MELPMKYFTQAVEIVLIQNAENDGPELRLSPELWRQAVLDSNYVSAQEAMRLGTLPEDAD
jgi:hypothetical protein